MTKLMMLTASVAVGALLAGCGSMSGNSSSARQSGASSATAQTAPSAQVRGVQQALTSQGFYSGEADGVWGPRTSEGLRSFQQARGLDQTGQMDSRTMAALGVNPDGTRTTAGQTGQFPSSGSSNDPRTTGAGTSGAAGASGTGTATGPTSTGGNFPSSGSSNDSRATGTGTSTGTATGTGTSTGTATGTGVSGATGPSPGTGSTGSNFPSSGSSNDPQSRTGASGTTSPSGSTMSSSPTGRSTSQGTTGTSTTRGSTAGSTGTAAPPPRGTFPSSGSSNDSQQPTGMANSSGRTGSDMNRRSGQMASGMTSDPARVREVQESLERAGHDVGEVDGIWGPRTERALRDFQRSRGLDASGRLDDRTVQELGVRARS